MTLPLISGFRSNILQNPILVDAIDFASQTPILQGFFNNVGNFSGDLAPVIRAYTVSVASYLHSVCRRHVCVNSPVERYA